MHRDESARRRRRPRPARALTINLRARHYDVDVAADGTTALRLAARHPPDAIVLDLGLTDMDGTHVVAGLRGWCDAPILVLSARHDQGDKVAALDAGADDYITNPFGMDELLARLRAALRRAAVSPQQDPIVQTASFTVDLAARRVSREGAEVRLTPTEWHLLEVLARAAGRLVTQQQLLREVWGAGAENESQYLRVYIGTLRRKLEPTPSRPRHLLTEPGIGSNPDGSVSGALSVRTPPLRCCCGAAAVPRAHVRRSSPARPVR